MRPQWYDASRQIQLKKLFVGIAEAGNSVHGLQPLCRLIFWFFQCCASRFKLMDALEQLNKAITRCVRCPRLVRWREACAQNPPRRYLSEKYWAKPLPGFGDPAARLLIVGLAPAAHGGNRTGRMFTGDRSGDWLYGALHAAGFANQANSDHCDDGLKLHDCYITAAVHCAPPGNKPAIGEFQRCRPYLVQELKHFRQVKVVIALGKIAFDSFIRAYEEKGESDLTEHD